MPLVDDFCCKEKSLCIFTLSSWQFLPPNLALLGLWSQVHYDPGNTTRKVMLLGLSATIPNEEIHELLLRVANYLKVAGCHDESISLTYRITSATQTSSAGFNLLKQYVSSHRNNFPWITGQQENTPWKPPTIYPICCMQIGTTFAEH